MNAKMMKTAIASVLTVSALGFQSTAPATAAEGDFNLTIMHTNDTHANLDMVANRVTLVNQIREEHPNNLLLDAGDVFSGTLYFNTFQGQADLEFMNLMKYDAMTFGNHEFDLGASAEGHAALGEFIGGADFPFVSANVNVANDAVLAPLDNNAYTKEFNNGEIYNGIIKEIDGEEIGVFGLTTEETTAISSPGAVEFTNYITAAKEAVAAFQAAGVNKIVALTHIGFDDSKEFDNDQLLAEAVAGIDVIVGGHTHSELKAPVVNNTHGEPIVIVQAKQYNEFLGQLDLTFNEAGVITSHAGKLHEVKVAAADSTATDLLKPYADEIEALKNQSTGAIAKVVLNGGRGITGVRASETNLGNLITDGMLATAKTIDPETTIALQNGGGIRASINEGDITVGEVLTVLPFGNPLAIMELTGTELKAALEISVKDYPNEFGGFLHVAGMKFTFDPSAPAGSRVTDIQVEKNGKYKKFKEKDTYKVATNTFTAKGGDGYAPFAAAYADGRVSEPGNTDWEMFIEHIKGLKEVNPQLEGRIEAKTPSSKACQKRAAAPAPDCIGSR